MKLEKLTFKEVYTLPFHKVPVVGTWVYDEGHNFCFQFEEHRNLINEKLLSVINGDSELQNPDLFFTHENGEIRDNKGHHLISIRGWGNLTSPNCLGFSPEEASNIQDTLAEYIIERLNFRNE